MSGDIVVDTNVIVHGTSGRDDDEDLFHCSYVMSNIIHSDDYKFAIDIECKILEEYKSNLGGKRTPHSVAFEELIEREAFGSGEGNNFSFRFPIEEDDVEGTV